MSFPLLFCATALLSNLSPARDGIHEIPGVYSSLDIQFKTYSGPWIVYTANFDEPPAPVTPVSGGGGSAISFVDGDHLTVTVESWRTSSGSITYTRSFDLKLVSESLTTSGFGLTTDPRASIGSFQETGFGSLAFTIPFGGGVPYPLSDGWSLSGQGKWASLSNPTNSVAPGPADPEVELFLEYSAQAIAAF